MAYPKVADVKDYIGGISGTGDDALLEVLLGQAVKYFEEETQREFDDPGADTTRYFTVGEDTDGPLLIFDRDICSITTVTNGDSDSTVIASDEYTTLPRNDTPYYAIKLLNSSDSFWEYEDDPDGAVSVAGTWTYSATPPADVAYAVTALAAALYRGRDPSVDREAIVTLASGVVISPTIIPTMVRKIIDRYKWRPQGV